MEKTEKKNNKKKYALLLLLLLLLLGAYVWMMIPGQGTEDIAQGMAEIADNQTPLAGGETTEINDGQTPLADNATAAPQATAAPATPAVTPQANVPAVVPNENAAVAPTPEVTPGTTPEATPETTPESTPEVTPETTPETTPEVTPEVTPETTPETTPEQTPETTPETTPEQTPEVLEDELTERAIRFLAQQLSTEGTTANEYFAPRGKGTTLDSEGKNWAPDVNAALVQGVKGLGKGSEFGWRIYKNANNDYTITWTNEDLGSMHSGEKLARVCRYNTVEKKFVYGTAKVAKKSVTEGGQTYSFIVIDGSTFAAE